MSFNARVVFTGICAFVPNSLPKEESGVRICVVLPDGRSRKLNAKQGFDGTNLRRHRGFLQFKARQLVAAIDPETAKTIPDDANVIWYLDRHRVSFAYDQNANEPELPFLNGQVPNSLAKMGEMLPRYATVDADVVGEDRWQKTVGQIVLQRGVLRVANPGAQWVFPNVLTTEVIEQNLANEIHLEMSYLDGISIVATRYGQTEPDVRWVLQSVKGEDVEITVANLCDENPLRWETEVEELSPEDDFRWYYTLLSENTQQELFQKLKGLRFPIPLRPVNQAGNGQGMNCVPLGTGAQEIPTS